MWMPIQCDTGSWSGAHSCNKLNHSSRFKTQPYCHSIWFDCILHWIELQTDVLKKLNGEEEKRGDEKESGHRARTLLASLTFLPLLSFIHSILHPSLFFPLPYYSLSLPVWWIEQVFFLDFKVMILVVRRGRAERFLLTTSSQCYLGCLVRNYFTFKGEEWIEGGREVVVVVTNWT